MIRATYCYPGWLSFFLKRRGLTEHAARKRPLCCWRPRLRQTIEARLGPPHLFQMPRNLRNITHWSGDDIRDAAIAGLSQDIDGVIHQELAEVADAGVLQCRYDAKVGVMLFLTLLARLRG